MFNTYHNQIKELRKAIRLSAYHKELYEECFDSYKEHTSIIKKTDTQLRKVESGKEAEFPSDMVFLFTDWIESKNIRSKKKQQELINAKLTQMASIYVQSFLKDRVASLSEEKRLLKGLETQERLVVEKLEKEIHKNNDPKVSSIIPFIISVENLKIDEEETQNIYDLGSGALVKLKESIKDLSKISEFPVSILEDNSENGKNAFRTFFMVVEAYMFMCAFKNELKQYTDSRDLHIHLDSLKEFMSTYINLLIIDWTEHKKIRQSLQHIRNTINIVETLLAGLNKKIIKIKSELTLTSEELNAILKRLDIS